MSSENDEKVEDDLDVERASKYFRRHDQDDLNVKCPYCESDNATCRAEAYCHNHPPVGLCLDEVWECDDCGRYFQAIYRLTEIRPLVTGKVAGRRCVGCGADIKNDASYCDTCGVKQ
jgi:DNA-directed RNA polymerase subunit RPC12/RpoP